MVDEIPTLSDQFLPGENVVSELYLYTNLYTKSWCCLLVEQPTRNMLLKIPLFTGLLCFRWVYFGGIYYAKEVDCSSDYAHKTDSGITSIIYILPNK